MREPGSLGNSPINFLFSDRLPNRWMKKRSIDYMCTVFQNSNMNSLILVLNLTLIKGIPKASGLRCQRGLQLISETDLYQRRTGADLQDDNKFWKIVCFGFS